MNADVSQKPAGAALLTSRRTARMPAAGPILRIENLCVEYRSSRTGSPVKRAVNRPNLSVEQGKMFGFLGPNGAGKITTMNVLLGDMDGTLTLLLRFH